MAQLLCFVALSMILALGSIGECNSMVLNTNQAGTFGRKVDGIDDIASDILENSHIENEADEILDEFENSTAKIPEERLVIGEISRNDNLSYRSRIRASDVEKVGSSRRAARSNTLPRGGKDCCYPYLSSTPLYCNYYMVFGKYEEGDKLVWDEKFTKPKNSENSESHLTVNVKFLEEDNANKYNISYIYVEDSESSENIYDDYLIMRKGGIDRKSFEMEIISVRDKPEGYRVAVYVRPNKSSRV